MLPISCCCAEAAPVRSIEIDRKCHGPLHISRTGPRWVAVAEGQQRVLAERNCWHVWAFRYYVEENGRSVYKRQIIGTVVEFPKRKDAEKALMKLRVDINGGPSLP